MGRLFLKTAEEKLDSIEELAVKGIALLDYYCDTSPIIIYLLATYKII